MFKILEECCTPKRGTKYSAYVDLFSREDVVIGAGETKVIKLGVKIDPDFFIYEIGGINITCGGIVESDDDASDKINNFLKSHYLEVALRSSLSVKGLIIANGIGIIDLDYDKEIGLIVHNPFTNKKTYWKDEWELINTDFIICKGDKVCQCCLKEHKSYLMGYESENISSIKRFNKWQKRIFC